MKRIRGKENRSMDAFHSHLDGRERFYFATGILDSSGASLPGRAGLIGPESLGRIQKKLEDCAVCRRLSLSSSLEAESLSVAESGASIEPDLHIFYRALEKSGHTPRREKRSPLRRIQSVLRTSFSFLQSRVERPLMGRLEGALLGAALLLVSLHIWNRHGSPFPGGGDLTFFHKNAVLKMGDLIETKDEAARIVIQRNHRRLGVIHLDPESRIIYRRGHGRDRPTLELVDGAAEVLIQEDTRPGMLSIQSGNIRTEFHWPPSGSRISARQQGRSVSGNIQSVPSEVHFRMEADPTEDSVAQAPESNSVIGVEVYEGNVNVVNAESSRKLYSINKGESIQLTVDDGDISSVDRN